MFTRQRSLGWWDQTGQARLRQSNASRDCDGPTAAPYRLGLGPLRDRYRLRERRGVRFQSADLPHRIKIWEALDLFAAFYRRSLDWQPLLEQMGLTEGIGAYFGKLSGGQRQRVFIALALVNNPELVFLDELPTGLDPQARRAMWDKVRSIREQSTTVFLTTHFMEQAECLCDGVAIIDHGKIVALDTPQNLIDSLGAENRVVFEVDAYLDEESLVLIGNVVLYPW
jgi:ABC-2 type transport system ATP-binding protein